MFDPTAVAADGGVAFKLLLFSVLLHYLQNISSIYFLAHVSVLSHQVAQSLKRLMVITCSVIYFLTPVTPLNVLGMGLALVGFSAYSLTKQPPERRRSSVDVPQYSDVEKDSSRDVERGNGSTSGGGGGSGYHSSGANIRHPATPRDTSPSAAALSIAASSAGHSASLYRPPVSPAPDSPGVLDSYALVRQSELGSSHLLQSPSRSKLLPPPHLHPHGGAGTNGHHHPHPHPQSSHARVEEAEFLLDDFNREQRGGGGEEEPRRNGKA